MKQAIYNSNSGEFTFDDMLPCPFCGCTPEIMFIGNDYTKKRQVEIKCGNRDCRVTIITGGIHSNSETVAKWSIEKWNKRV